MGLLAAALGTAVLAQAPAQAPSAGGGYAGTPAHMQSAVTTALHIAKNHYAPQALDDAMSAKAFDRYLNTLDPERMVLLAADVERFRPRRETLDDEIRALQLETPFAIYTLYQQRLRERYSFAERALEAGFDFTNQDELPLSRTKEPWVRTTAELDELWRLRVKSDWLRLRLGGSSDSAIQTLLKKRYALALANAAKVKSDDVFQIFMDSYALSADPHTNYLGVRASEDFAISMRLSLIGIGAVLQERDEMATIRELVPGGPAALSEQLQVGDRIVGIGEGADATPVDVVGWRLDDVVARIRGKEDSVVTLEVLPENTAADQAHKRVQLVRKKISLEKQAAKKAIEEVGTGAHKRRIGIITLPSFYQDFEGRRQGGSDYRSASRDVQKIIEELASEKVDGIVMDLRNNGGGSLDEAVELTSLFVGPGPVVQQRRANGAVTVFTGRRERALWNGPLAVLVNRLSASASEIFAAAIQDYGRGLVLGEPTFGKGTVQTVVDYDQASGTTPPRFGGMRLTIAQFYRINGGTTQLRGVEPDLAFPSLLDAKTFGESSYDNALPWNQIAPARYEPVGQAHAPAEALRQRHMKRTASNLEFQFLREDVQEAAAMRERKTLSLNEASRRAERDNRDTKEKARNAQRRAQNPESAAAFAADSSANDGLQGNERSLSKELAQEKLAEQRKDFIRAEAAAVLVDDITLQQQSAQQAQQAIQRAQRKTQGATASP